jgi:hypothetical protein
MISIAFNGARRKGPMGRFTCEITPTCEGWAAPAAKEVAR